MVSRRSRSLAAKPPITPTALLARFLRHRKGATAVEFAMISVPFFALLMAVVETALVFFANQVLETGVHEAARLIRTGQAQSQGFSETQFRQEICDRITSMFTCANVKTDVRTYASFAAANLNKPLDNDGNLVENFAYQPGGASEIVVVRAYYEWPTFVPNLGLGVGEMANGNRLLVSTAAFRNEPF